VSWLVTASLGSAQESDPESVTVQAREHFGRGVEHYSEGNYAAALAEFQRSYELSPTYKLLYNLAQVQMELHNYSAAFGLFTDYLKSGGTAITPERASAVQQDLARLEQSIAEVSIDVDQEGAQITVNAAPVGTSPLREPVRVNVGSAIVRVEKAGFAAFEHSVSVVGADKKRVSVELKPLMASLAPAAPAALQPSTTSNLTPAWIGLGSAFVLGGAAVTFGVLSVSARQQQDDLLARYPGRPSELDAARSRLQTFAALTDAFAAASLVTGLVGLYFLWSPPQRREAPPAERAQLRLTASPSGLTLRGAF
jgi:tetratricopeptide (TPR) repeat protein